MPTYEHQCEKGHITEAVFPITTEQRVVPCDQCEGQAQRIISRSTFILKGGGWYSSDYKNEYNLTAGSED